VAVARGLLAGLADLGVEPKVGDELARISEPADVADAGHERRGRVQVDPGHGHQPAHLGGVDRGLCQRPVDLGDLLVEEADLAQAALNCLALVHRELEAC
jgi:hypothetical protein